MLSRGENETLIDDSYYREILLRLHFPWVLLGQNAQITDSNHAAEKFFGFENSSIVNKSIFELCPSINRALWQLIWDISPSRKTFKYTRKLTLADKSEHFVELEVSHLIINEINFLSIIIDDQTYKIEKASEPIQKVTDLKVLNKTLQNLNNELIRTQDSLASGEQRYKQIIRAITDYIYSVRIDNSGFYTTIHTPACISVTGYSVEEFNESPSLWIDIVHLDDKFRLLDFIANVGSPEEELTIEHRIWHKNGTVRWIQNTIIVFYNPDNSVGGYDGVISDITTRKKAEIALRDSEEQFRSLIQSLDQGLALYELIVNEQGEPVDYKFIDINPSFEKQTGFLRENIIGKSIQEVFPNFEKYWIDKYGEVVKSGKSIHFEKYIPEVGKYYEVTAYKTKSGYFAEIINDVTSRIIAQEHMRLSEEKFRGVFNMSPDALMLCEMETGSLIDFNQKFISEFYNSNNEITKGIQNYSLPEFDDWEFIENEIKTNKKIADKEISLSIKKDKRNTYLLSANTLSVSQQAYILYEFRNISKRKNLEYVLRFIGQRGTLSEGAGFFSDLAIFLSDLLSISHIIIAEVNTETQLANPIVILADGKLEHLSAFSLEGTPCKEIIELGTYVCNSELQKKYPHIESFRNWNTDTYIGINMVNSEGKVSGYLAILNRSPFEDPNSIEELLQLLALRASHELENMHHFAKITDYREHLEDLVLLRTTELESTVQALNIARERAETASNAKSRFLSNMSHELRTPLNAILGYASALQKDKNLNEKQCHNLATIETSGHHLLSIINEILDYSKIDAGKTVIEIKDFNLLNMLHSAINISKHKANEKTLDFYYTENNNMPELVAGDEKRVKQIVINLVSNAVKYTETGEVRVNVQYVKHNKLFIMEVIDTGQGIAEENFHKIFDPFTQLHPNKNYIEGTGLGLSITKQLIDLMGGKISFNSQLNKGSTFIVELTLPAVSWQNKNRDTNIEEIDKRQFKLQYKPNSEILTEILECAHLGNFIAIEKKINLLLETDGRSFDFCKTIHDNCNRYNDEKIIEICNSLLNINHGT